MTEEPSLVEKVVSQKQDRLNNENESDELFAHHGIRFVRRLSGFCHSEAQAGLKIKGKGASELKTRRPLL